MRYVTQRKQFANHTYRFCVAPDGSDVEIVGLEENVEGEGASSAEQGETSEPDEQHCHFHAGVE